MVLKKANDITITLKSKTFTKFITSELTAEGTGLTSV